MTTALRNYYEELIDKMMEDEVCGLNAEIRKTLEGLPKNKKRLAILSILDQDRDLFVKIKKTFYREDVSKTEHIRNLVETLREYVKVGDFERKTKGEVLTPPWLVEDMLNTLPKEVWSNPELKWLDSCSGVGMFQAVIIEKLMGGLNEWEKNDEKRYKHIVENMIYMGELQAKNAFLILCSMDPKDEYSLNIYNGSFLDDKFDAHCKEVWGIDKFDLITINPPYQTNTPGEKKTHPIWDKFVKKSVEILTEGGRMVAVHPSGWRNIDGRFKDTQELLRSKQIEYLEIHNADDGVKTFGAATRYDFYCVKNSPNTAGNKTTIKCQDGKVVKRDISKMEFIPNGMFDEIERLLAKDGEERVEVLHSYSAYETRQDWMSKEKNEEFKFPCVDNVNVKKEAGKIFYSNTKDKGHFGVPKIIVGSFGINTMCDLTGKFGLTQHGMAIVDDVENIQQLEIALNVKEFKVLNKMTDCAGIKDVPLNRKIVALFRKDFWKEFL